jgi:hypothetical protein
MRRGLREDELRKIKLSFTTFFITMKRKNYKLKFRKLKAKGSNP